jgi:hypothetical protein
MGEHPVRVQPQLIMPPLPGRRHRASPLDNQRIHTGAADRPCGSKPRGPRPDHHHPLIHPASVTASGTVRQPRPLALPAMTFPDPGKKILHQGVGGREVSNLLDWWRRSGSAAMIFEVVAGSLGKHLPLSGWPSNGLRLITATGESGPGEVC